MGGGVRTTLNRLAWGGTFAILAACSPASSRHATYARPSSDVYVTVTNQNWLDVDVFAVRGGSRFRLGQVGGSGSARLRIPANAIVGSQVQLLVDPVGSNDRYLTEVISVDPDQRVQLNVASTMRMSSYAVLRR